MKKIIIYLLLLFMTVGVNSSFANIEQQNIISIELIEVDDACHHGQCHATARSTGNRCKHCVSNSGDYYCWQH